MRHGFLIAAALTMTVAGCDVFQTRPPELAVDAYAKAQQYMGSGDYSSASAVLTDFVAQHPTDRYASDAWVLLGDCRMQLKDWPGAQSAYEQAVTQPRTPAIAARAMAGAGDALAAQGKPTRAINAWEDALRNGEAAIDAPRVLMSLGRAYLGRGNWLMGRDRLARIVRSYPRSDEAPIARDILSQPGDVFSVELGTFAGRAEAEGFIEGLAKKGVAQEVRLVERWKPAPADASQGFTEPGPDRPFAVRVGQFVSRDAAQRECDKLKAAAADAVVFP